MERMMMPGLDSMNWIERDRGGKMLIELPALSVDVAPNDARNQ